MLYSVATAVVITTAVVGQLSTATLSWVGTWSTSKRRGVNGRTIPCDALVLYVWSHSMS